MVYRVVVIGGGFAGVRCCQELVGTGIDVTLLDRRNFHLFQPLLYQVATGGLSPGDIAAPLRSVLKSVHNTTVLMGEVKDLDADQREVILEDGRRIYWDSLVVATGATHSYFGNDKWAAVAPG
jgi:NADH dehydrogenase